MRGQILGPLGGIRWIVNRDKLTAPDVAENSANTDWRTRYQAKLLTVTAAAGMVKAGQRACTSIATAEPQLFLKARCARWPELRDVEVLSSNTMQLFGWFDKECGAAFKIEASYLSGYAQPLDRA